MASGPGVAGLQAGSGHRLLGHAEGAAIDRLRSEHRSARAARHRLPRRVGRERCASATTSAASPVVLVFAYFDCPMLCTQVINGLSSALGVLSLESRARISRSSRSASTRRDTPASAAAKKAVYLERYKRPGAAARLAFPHRRSAVRSSASRTAAGFRYAWDADTKQFAHPSGVIVLTPGRPAGDATCSASSTAPAICASASSRRRPARSARRSTRCCSTAITTTR